MGDEKAEGGFVWVKAIHKDPYAVQRYYEEKGRAEGEAKARKNLIIRLSGQGRSHDEIAAITGYPLEEVESVLSEAGNG